MAPAADASRAARILLTGGTGFVGAHLAPALVAAFPHADRLLLRLPGETAAREGWRTAEGHVTDAAAMTRLVADFKPDLVLHLAAQSSAGASLKAAEETWRVNFDGTLELASALAHHAPGATFFFVSSSETYGENFRSGPADETTPLAPANAYARSKAAAESMLPDVLRADQRLIVVRPFNHTGPGQDTRFVLPAFAAQIADIEAGGPPVLRTGNLDAMREFLDVRDVSAAYVALLRADTGARATFNVASGRAHRVGDILEMLRARSRRAFTVENDPERMRPSDIPHAAGSSARLHALTGWAPQIPLEATLDALLDYWRARRGA